MILLQENIKDWSNDQILSLLELNMKQLNNKKTAENIINKMNPIKEKINPARKECDDIISSSMISKRISKRQADLLTEYYLEIKDDEKKYNELKKLLNECENIEKNIEKEEKNIVKIEEKYNELTEEKEEKKKFKFGYKIFKDLLVKEEIKAENTLKKEVKKVKKENINDLYFEAKMLQESIKNIEHDKNELKEKMLKDRNFVNSYDIFVDKNNKRLISQKQELNKKLKMISSYKRIKADLDYIMSLDVEHIKNKRKKCSYKQYRVYLENIYSNIKSKNEEMLRLKEDLTPGLIASLEGLFKIDKELEISDPIIRDEKVVITEIPKEKHSISNIFAIPQRKAEKKLVLQS